MNPARERPALARASSSVELRPRHKRHDGDDGIGMTAREIIGATAERPSLQSDRVQTDHHNRRPQYRVYEKEQLPQPQPREQLRSSDSGQKVLSSQPSDEGLHSHSSGSLGTPAGNDKTVAVASPTPHAMHKHPELVAQGSRNGQISSNTSVKPPQVSSPSLSASYSASSSRPFRPGPSATPDTAASAAAFAAVSGAGKLLPSGAAAVTSSSSANPTALATTHQGHPHAHPQTSSTAQRTPISHEHTLLRRSSFFLPSGHDHKRRHQRSQNNQGFFESTLPSASASTARCHSPPPATTGVAALPSSTAMQMQQRSPSTIAAQTAFQHQAENLRSDPGTLASLGPTSGFATPSSQITVRRVPLTQTSGTGTETTSQKQQPKQQQQQQPPLQLKSSQNQLTSRHLVATAAASLAFPRRSGSAAVGATSENVQFGRSMKPEKEKSKMKLFSKPKHIVMSRDKDKDRDRDREKEKEEKSKTPSSAAYPGSSGLSKVINSSSVSVNESTRGNANNQIVNTPFYSTSNSSVNTVVPAQEHKVSVERDRDITTAGSASSTMTHGHAVATSGKEKEKDMKHKHHFLSRPKLKLKDKDDHYHLPLSSAASNSMPMDPNAPQSLYSFAPSSPPNIGFGKSLDLRHGGRSWREKKKEEKEKSVAQDAAFREDATDWASMGVKVGDVGPTMYSGAGSGGHNLGHIGHGHGLYGTDVSLKDTLSGFGLNNMAPEDAWDYLKAKLLVLFEGEDIRVALEDLNRLVSIHLQCCMQRHSPGSIIEDLRDLLQTGFDSLSHNLGHLQEDAASSRDRDRVVPHLAQMWLFVFGTVLPFLQAVFLPLDVEFKGRGSIVPRREAREIWATKTADLTNAGKRQFTGVGTSATPTVKTNTETTRFSTIGGIDYDDELDVRAIVLIYFRDTVILSRYDTLLATFSRLSLESMNENMRVNALGSSSSSIRRPSTASGLDAGLSGHTTSKPASIRATERGAPGSSSGGHQYADSTGFSDSRARATSNASSNPEYQLPSSASTSHSPSRGSMLYTTLPAVASSTTLASLASNATVAHYNNATDPILLITETVARMLQCISVLASVHTDNEAQKQVEELSKALKHNWLGRARTGRDRRGFIGAKVMSSKPKSPLPRLDSAGSRLTGTPPPLDQEGHGYFHPSGSPRRWSQCSPTTTQFPHLQSLQLQHEPGYFDPYAHAHTISQAEPARTKSPQQKRWSSDRKNSDFTRAQPRSSIDSDRSGRPSYHRHRYYHHTEESIDDNDDK
ncbi:hypothetical protein KEM54_006678 [Ascosphaera aggregata]|nr:hypothetical protein KEM54_006678 [Ascosphaera aggregata]